MVLKKEIAHMENVLSTLLERIHHFGRERPPARGRAITLGARSVHHQESESDVPANVVYLRTQVPVSVYVGICASVRIFGCLWASLLFSERVSE